ncbi:MAG TPA: PAS domain-containing protein, partial [Verrucomicrobiae bacterium]|nr:PAS domain-containing protein [Verrucomicrobiae bacterium]
MKAVSTKDSAKTRLEALRAENSQLRLRLEEAEETLSAIRSGGIDAVVVEQAGQNQIYTLAGADRPYRLFVEEMHQGAATLYADGTIAWCNRQLGLLLKLPQSNLMGMSLREFVLPEDQPIYDHLLPKGKAQSARAEAQLRRADGSLVPAFLTFNALPEDCGSAIGMLVTDLTPERRHEELSANHTALRASEDRLRRAHQVARIGTFEWNIQTGQSIWDEDLEAMYGLSPGSFASTQAAWEQLIHPDDRAETLRRVHHALACGKFEGEWRTVWPDGSTHWLAGRATVLRDESGKPLKLFGVNIDVTERKQTEEALRAAQAQLEEHARQLETRVAERTSDLQAINQ